MKTTIGTRMVGVCALSVSLFAGCDKVPLPGGETGGSGGAAAAECAQKGGLAPDAATVATLEKMVKKSADDLDPATEKLGIAPRLMNPALASSVDLSPFGVQGAVYVPVQVSKEKGGRISAFQLAKGEETVTGYYVADGLVWKQTLKRLTGDATPAAVGDEYALSIRSLDGKEHVQAKGKLDAFKDGSGSFSFEGQDPQGYVIHVHVDCILWSIVKDIDFDIVIPD